MLHLFLLIRKNQELFSPPNFVFSALWFFQWRTGSGGFILVIPNQCYSFPRPLDSGKIEFCPSSSLLRNQSFECMVHSFLFVSSINWEFGFFFSIALRYAGNSESENCSAMSNSLRPHGLYNPWFSPGQHTGMGSLSLLQGIFPTEESNCDLVHCRWILYQLSFQGSPCWE